MPQIMFRCPCYHIPCFEVKVRGQDNILGSKSKFNVKCPGLGSPSAENRHHQSKESVGVSGISGVRQMMLRMRSFGF